MTPTGTVRIEPGAVYRHDVVIDEWHDFDAVGKYEIRVSLRFPIMYGDLSYEPPAETALSMVIGPRDKASFTWPLRGFGEPRRWSEHRR